MMTKEKIVAQEARLTPFVTAVVGKLSEYEPELLEFARECVKHAFKERTRHKVDYYDTGSSRKENIEISINSTGVRYPLEDYETVEEFLDESTGNKLASYQSGFGFYPERLEDDLSRDLEDEVRDNITCLFPPGLSDEEEEWLWENNDLIKTWFETRDAIINRVKKLPLSEVVSDFNREILHEKVGYDS